MKLHAWTVHTLKEPMRFEERHETPGAGEVIIRVAGCGVCHTDLGYFYDGVPMRHELPLTLGHEISGVVVETGHGAEGWMGSAVIVPAVMPCGRCDACRAGRGSVCPKQIFPGNDVHGGFATHVRVPSLGLCRVPNLSDVRINQAGVDLESLSVLADAITTPYQSIMRSSLTDGDLAIVIGVGGVGGFAVQIAAALGAHVIAIDVDPTRLHLMSQHGAALTLRADQLDFKALKKAVKGFAEERHAASWRWKIFECSGTPAGQQTAFGLIEHGAYLGVVGFTPAKIEVRLSNLMAYDAVAQGNWGCQPDLYPDALELVLSGKVALGPFIEKRPLSHINEGFEDVHAKKTTRRLILCPER